LIGSLWTISHRRSVLPQSPQLRRHISRQQRSKYDKHHPELKEADARWCLRRLNALASGVENPAEKPLRVTKTKAEPKKRKKESIRASAIDFPQKSGRAYLGTRRFTNTRTC
jgi:hypothetical protein